MMPTEFRHPQYDLEQSIEVARQITNRGAGATVSTHQLAAFLGYKSTNNGAYLTRVAAARLFGLVEGRAEAIEATDRATQIIFPDAPETADRARLEAFQSVPLYNAILEAFRGREISEAGMVNTLVGRFGVSSKDAKSVLARLLASAGQAGLFKVAGPNRMIEPTITPTTQQRASEPEPSSRATPVAHTGSARQFPKIIDGALELMPAGPPWDEAEYMEWLDFFDKACRVYYRIAREKRPEE
jgi:hypothetical protein